MKPNKTFAIRHKETKELWRAPSGKTSWRATGHAKNAWKTLDCYGQEEVLRRCERYGVSATPTGYNNRLEFPRFDDQTTWELVELRAESETQLLKATALLRQCLGRITDHWIEDKVKEFLTEVGIEH